MQNSDVLVCEWDPEIDIDDEEMSDVEDLELPEELNLTEELGKLYIRNRHLNFLVEIVCTCQWKQIVLLYDKHVNVQDSGVAQAYFLSFHKELQWYMTASKYDESCTALFSILFSENTSSDTTDEQYHVC